MYMAPYMSMYKILHLVVWSHYLYVHSVGVHVSVRSTKKALHIILKSLVTVRSLCACVPFMCMCSFVCDVILRPLYLFKFVLIISESATKLVVSSLSIKLSQESYLTTPFQE